MPALHFLYAMAMPAAGMAMPAAGILMPALHFLYAMAMPAAGILMPALHFSYTNAMPAAAILMPAFVLPYTSVCKIFKIVKRRVPNTWGQRLFQRPMVPTQTQSHSTNMQHYLSFVVLPHAPGFQHAYLLLHGSACAQVHASHTQAHSAHIMRKLLLALLNDWPVIQQF